MYTSNTLNKCFNELAVIIIPLSFSTMVNYYERLSHSFDTFYKIPTHTRTLISMTYSPNSIDQP